MEYNTQTVTKPVADDEWLARFVYSKSHVRSSDGTVKPDAFIPSPKNLELSVIRHLNLSEKELWNIGYEIGSSRPATLYGRADLQAHTARNLMLNVLPANSPPKNHAVITGWPSGKASQKILALQLASRSRYSSATSSAIE